ncbi:MAG: formate--tetrahydrofolate ligase [Gemmatimonadetes bacterium]|nr:formate--tetrahydrofolate ligase [Gemmatimonadota bacterium]
MPVTRQKPVPSDLEIAQSATPLPIEEVASELGLDPERLERYGRFKAKVPVSVLDESRPRGRLVLVTGMTPTTAGEGKSTVSIGLAQALRLAGRKVVACLREPSLGPVFGMKGGAAGGGYSQVIPMEDINLHFTGDLHAMTAANNLLAAMLDNHLQQGNRLDIDVRRILWKRCLDMNDRALRNVVVGLGGSANGVPRQDGFQITVASEVMAILCLASGIEDLRERLGRIVVAFSRSGEALRARDLKADGAMTLLLRDALNPNLVQTLEGGPAFVHGGPFANIAHGCNSLLATRMGLSLADYVVTEAGFGSDLGAEKFFDIKCRFGNLEPAAAVIVATVRALRRHGGAVKEAIKQPDAGAVRRGLPNLAKHVEIVRAFGVPPVVALNRFTDDAEDELDAVRELCASLDVPVALTDVWALGGEGGAELAERVQAEADAGRSRFRLLYEDDLPIEEKLRRIVTQVYGGRDVTFSAAAEKSIRELKKIGMEKAPVCVAKTQYSLSDDPGRIARPEGFTIHVQELRPSAGAGFVVAITGDIMTMPGLPKVPAAEAMGVGADGRGEGLF